MNKILIKLYVPTIEEQYDLWIPTGRKIYSVIVLLIKAINDLSLGEYKPNKMPKLYSKLTGVEFDMNLKVSETLMKNGTEVILI